ncbi:glycine receptor subunit alpha-3-like [Pomacea canaliculata]|nr:glycine receptor subunit alpha-3-like [Pomacea canaliculata]
MACQTKQLTCHHRWPVIAVLLLVWASSVTECSKKRSKLLEEILNAAESEKDFKNWPPLYDSDKATNVQVKIYVDTIDSVNEATMDFTVSMLLHLRWKDERLVKFNMQQTFKGLTTDFLEFDSANIKRIWVPDLFFPNEKKAFFHEVMITNQISRLYKDASILHISRLSMTLSCPMNLRFYPFDKQFCSILIMSFGYADDKITLDWMNVTEPIQSTEIDQEENPIMVNDDVELPQFKVTGQSAERCKKRYHQKSGNHSCLEAKFYLERNITYYVVQMYIPSILIVMLSWISFWLNVNSVPGRISLGVLTVLTMTTQSSAVNASLPRVSYTKAIDVWMSTCLVFVFCSLLEFAVVNVLSRKDSLRDFSIRRVFSIPKRL